MATLGEIRAKLQRAVVNGAAAVEHEPKVAARRLKRLQKLLTRIDEGADIARRDLQNALTEQEWEVFEQDNGYLRDEDEILNDSRPDALNSYLELLKKADFYYSRAESTKKTRRSRIDHLGQAGKTRLYNKADTYYERAIERLNEILSAADAYTQHQILMHLDRPWDLGDFPNLGPVLMPRLRKSRSINSLSVGGPTKFDAKRENKRTAIQSAIAALQL